MTMPEIVGIASATLPEANIAMVPGADDVPDVQTAFDISGLARDLGWAPKRDRHGCIPTGCSASLEANGRGRSSAISNSSGKASGDLACGKN